MSRFRRNNNHNIPEINTSALPDLVFAFMFFIMMVSNSRENTKLKIITPNSSTAEILNKNTKKSIYLGYKYNDKILYISFGDVTLPIHHNFEQYLQSFFKDHNNGTISEVRLYIDKDVHMSSVLSLEEKIKKIGVKKIIYITNVRLKANSIQ